MGHSKYLALILILMAPVVGLLMYRVVAVDGYEGDLTRLGGFSESRFGWNRPQQVFEKRLYDVGTKPSDLNRPYDVVVLGDSFSHSHRTEVEGWVNHFIDLSGASVLVFHLNDVKPSDFVRSEAFGRWPPKVLVVEIAERNVFPVLNALEAPPIGEAKAPNVLWDLEPRNLPRVAYYRPLERAMSFDDEMSAACWDLRQSFQRTLRARSVPAVALPLRQEYHGVFSSQDRQSVVVLRDDLERVEGDQLPWADVGKKVSAFAQAVSSRSGADLVTLVFPEKLTVYREFIEETEKYNNGYSDDLAAHWSMPRLDHLFIEAVRRKSVDVYLPNDTHTGSEANRLVAEALVGWLKKTGVSPGRSHG